jgi:hypothetical protein
LQGTDLLYIAGEKMVDSGTLGYPLKAARLACRFLFFYGIKSGAEIGGG